MTELSPDLQLVGDSLQRGWRADHARRIKRRPRRRLAIVAAIVILLVAVGAALASTILKTAAEEEQGLLGGHLLFKGTHPTCSQLSATSYMCALASPPTEVTAWDKDGKQIKDFWLDFKAATVDVHKHVDGGCVALDAYGLRWRCYLGAEAVKRGIIGANLLGQYLPEPPTL